MGTDAAAGDWGNNGANQGSGGSIRNIIRLGVRGPYGPKLLVKRGKERKREKKRGKERKKEKREKKREEGR